ncbi:MAG: hypothetical protein EA369_03225 [Bradymonadales bacterium]|nr:MAG: hypothetical protein EA369_03225 [Bradymonadales bacterium]
MLRKLVALFCISFGLSACGGPDEPEFEFQIEMNTSNNAQDILNQFSDLVTYRTVVSYDLLQAQAAIVDPFRALPTALVNQQNELRVFWHRALLEGRPFFPENFFASASATAPVVPLRRRALQVIVEFLLPFTEEINNQLVPNRYYVVAYGCFAFDQEERATQSLIEQLSAIPVPIFAGRSCNRCPSQEGIGDLPGFRLKPNPAGLSPTDAFIEIGGDEGQPTIAPLRACGDLPPPI